MVNFATLNAFVQRKKIYRFYIFPRTHLDRNSDSAVHQHGGVLDAYIGIFSVHWRSEDVFPSIRRGRNDCCDNYLPDGCFVADTDHSACDHGFCFTRVRIIIMDSFSAAIKPAIVIITIIIIIVIKDQPRPPRGITPILFLENLDVNRVIIDRSIEVLFGIVDENFPSYETARSIAPRNLADCLPIVFARYREAALDYRLVRINRRDW